MPLTDSPNLGLTRPAGTDPFLRTDYVATLDELDKYPGVYKCLSTAMPSWGAAQNGMLVSQIDTGKLVRWNGTAWTIVENYGRISRGSVTLNTDLAGGAAASYTVDTIRTYRPCTINVTMHVKVRKASASPQTVTFDPWLDGTTCGYGWNETISFPDGPAGTTKNYTFVFPVLGSRDVTHIGVQDHPLVCRVTVDNAVSNSITMLGVKSMVFLSEA